jgi:hypothetical protein
MNTRRINWIKGAAILGLLLGVFLLIEGIVTYLEVRHLVLDHLQAEAGSFISELETAAWQKNPESSEALSLLLNREVEAAAGEVAWVKIADQQGSILARSQSSSDEKLTEVAIESLLVDRKRTVTRTEQSEKGDVLVATVPFRYRLAGVRMISDEGPGRLGRPRFSLAEVALYLHGTQDAFWPLRRNLVISIVAAVALVVSMVVFLARIGSHLKGRELEQQMNLARQVQVDLLPQSCPECAEFEFSAECIPAWQVGGDYYDIFRTSAGQLTLTLGDVSGKGLPAALVMGLVNGAIRTSSHSWAGQNLGELAEEMNRLLLLRTSQERFLTLFWGICDPGQNRLYYVNAGHLPPFLLRNGVKGAEAIERLEIGGPVLGILPGANYCQGEIRFEPGDLLVLFSDGLVEATNKSEEEFGEDTLLDILKSNGEDPIDQIKDRILEAVKEFSDGRAYHDDLTLLLASRRMAPTT